MSINLKSWNNISSNECIAITFHASHRLAQQPIDKIFMMFFLYTVLYTDVLSISIFIISAANELNLEMERFLQPVNELL